MEEEYIDGMVHDNLYVKVTAQPSIALMNGEIR